MPPIEDIRQYIDRHITDRMDPVVFHDQFDEIVRQIILASSPRPQDAADTSAYLSYAISYHLMRSDNQHQQRVYGQAINDILHVRYNVSLFQTLMTADVSAGLRILGNLYWAQSILLSQPSLPPASDDIESTALPRLIQGLQARYQSWCTRLEVRSTPPVPASRLLEEPQQTRLVIGDTPSRYHDVFTVMTWNLQGSSHSAENKWNTYIRPRMRRNSIDIIAFQEIGTPPNSATREPSMFVTDQFGRADRWEVEVWNWWPGNDHYTIYYLDVDRQRVSLGLVVAHQPHPISVRRPLVVSDGLTNYRPALGIEVRINPNADYTTIFTFHSISGGGPNAPRMIREIDHHVASPWCVLGDFNRDPRPGQGTGVWIAEPVAEIQDAQGPTHPANDPTQMLDYAVHNTTSRMARDGQVLPDIVSDHRAVLYEFEI